MLDLRELIHSKGLVLRQAGLSGQGISMVLSGVNGLGPNGTKKIAEALGVTTDEVFAAYMETRRRLAEADAAKAQPAPAGA